MNDGSTRIGLMGFGRVGRSLFRLLYTRSDLVVAAISDVADPEALEYLLRFDTILGRFPDEISVREGHIYVLGRQIPLLQGEAPGDVDWSAYGVDVVVEASGRSRIRQELGRHLERGARRVVLCAPPGEPPDLTVIMGVNDDQLAPEHRLISNGSCTVHAAAPTLTLLEQAFGIERAFLSSIHAYSNQQNLADVPAQDPRRGRAAAENIIPQETKVAAVLEDILPSLAGRISASALNVPVHNGSVVDLVCWHRRPVTKTSINEVVRTAAASARWRRYLHYEDQPIVSSDVSRSPFSGIFDSDATMVLKGQVSKTLIWFDNSWGYVNRAAELIERLSQLDREQGRGLGSIASTARAGVPR